MASVQQQRQLVNKQFNSPIGLYSETNVKETLNREMKVLSNGATGIDFDHVSKPGNLANSAVLRMLEEEEKARRSGQKPDVKRVAWPPPPESTGENQADGSDQTTAADENGFIIETEQEVQQFDSIKAAKNSSVGLAKPNLFYAPPASNANFNKKVQPPTAAVAKPLATSIFRQSPILIPITKAPAVPPKTLAFSVGQSSALFNEFSAASQSQSQSQSQPLISFTATPLHLSSPPICVSINNSATSPRGWAHVSSPIPSPTSAGATIDATFYRPFSQPEQSYVAPPFDNANIFDGNQKVAQTPGGNQAQRGQSLQRQPSPGVVTLRTEAPISQKSSPVFNSQPAAASFGGGVNMRGDQKWPPVEYKVHAEEENKARKELAHGPAFRPRKVKKDYSQFFAQNALNATYSGYKAPPGTQHVASLTDM